jgi:hypothetical protein
VFVARLQVSVVQSDVSAQSALALQQPEISAFEQVFVDRSHKSAVHGSVSAHWAFDTQQPGMVVFTQPEPELHESAVQGLPSSHDKAVYAHPVAGSQLFVVHASLSSHVIAV